MTLNKGEKTAFGLLVLSLVSIAVVICGLIAYFLFGANMALYTVVGAFIVGVSSSVIAYSLLMKYSSGDIE
jgi:hypothetical protein